MDEPLLRCTICQRPLGIADDPMSADTGGDCWGCVGEMEARMGDEPSIHYLRREIEAGWRFSDGTAKPPASA